MLCGMIVAGSEGTSEEERKGETDMFNRYVTFGFNADGYGDYSDGFVADVQVPNADTTDDALTEIASIARKYYEKISEEEGYEMPYPWNWGDVAEEVPEEFFTENGVVFRSLGATDIWYHDEIVVNE